MNTKSLLVIPAAALALCVPKQASAYVGFGLNLSVPLFYPAPYYSAPVGYTRTVVYEAPSRAVGEQVTASPGSGYVWMAGHWSNVSARWVWVAGHWELPPSPSAIWTGGHWVQGNGGWVWVDGAWTVGNSGPQPQSGPPVPPGAAAPQVSGSSQPPALPGAIPAPSTPAPTAPEMADGTVVGDEPPAPIVEYVPASPYPDYVWIGGFWGWRGGWYWNAGHFAPRPFRGAAWVSGGWGRVGGRWAWHGGRWH
jgi:hypothetical protein